MDTNGKTVELQSLTGRVNGDEVNHNDVGASPDVITSNGDVIIEMSDTRRDVLARCRLCVAGNALLLLTCVGILVGLAVGLAIRNLHPSADALMWIGMPGELFLRMLKLMILPLIVCSVITGTASLEPKANGKISVVTFIFVVVTHVIACSIAVILCLVIKPGEGKFSAGTDQVDQEPMETQDIFADLLRNLVPDNLVEATFRKARTRYTLTTVNDTSNNSNNSSISNNITTTTSNNTYNSNNIISNISSNTSNSTATETLPLQALMTVSKYAGKTDGVNVLGLILVCTVVGMAINKVKVKASVFLSFFSGGTDVVIVIIRWFFWLSPVGVASLVAVSIGGVVDLSGTLAQLGRLLATVLVGIALHQMLVLPAILLVVTRRNPIPFLLSLIRPYMIAFASASSAMAIPEMLEACESQRIDRRVARFVIPLCTTINADGSAIYITAAAIFMAHFTGTHVLLSHVVIIGVLTAVAAMAIPSVPSASIVSLVIILTSLNIRVNDISLLFAVEWLLDRVRTASNVISHASCAAVTYHLCRKNLDPDDVKETLADEKTHRMD